MEDLESQRGKGPVVTLFITVRAAALLCVLLYCAITFRHLYVRDVA